MGDEKREYVVTAKSKEEMDSLLKDMLTIKNTPSSVPDRPVKIANPRRVNQRNTTYFLTDQEATALRQDPRVVAVENQSEFKISKRAFQDTSFDKTTTSTGNKTNWGFLRHTNTANVFGTSTADPGGTYDYVLDGTNVDVVILDSGIQANHPEFKDSQGNSRVQEVDWYEISGVPGTMPAGFYTDYDGHGTHVAGTLAGKTFGWARNANIYSIKLAGLEGPSDPNSGMSVSDAFDCILGWHLTKTTNNPTVINNSWGYVIYWDDTNQSLSFNPGVTQNYEITGGSYRGTPWSGSTKDVNKGHTGSLVDTDIYAFGFRVASVDADIEQLADNGVIVLNAAGNDSLKVDIETGTDYDNYVTATGYGDFYYHRGSSPFVAPDKGLQVGSFGTSFVSSTEAKSTYSNSGPGVYVYGAGDRIVSAISDTNLGAVTTQYYADSNFKQDVYSGTSMACPQIAGICALLLQLHPDWSVQRVLTWISNNSVEILHTTGFDNDYSSIVSLYGGSGKVAYTPFNGRRRYQLSEVV